MTLETLVRTALAAGASDVHLEGGLPMTLRVRGSLRRSGEAVQAGTLTELARDLLGADWNDFVERGSADRSCPQRQAGEPPLVISPTAAEDAAHSLNPRSAHVNHCLSSMW